MLSRVNTWSGGSPIRDEVSEVCAANAWDSWLTKRWGHLNFDELATGGDGGCCKLCSAVPGPSQAVRRAELLGATFALHEDTAVHVGWDNLDLIRKCEPTSGGDHLNWLMMEIC